MSLSFSPPVIAHRGASGYAPENTLVAFEKAKALGARWVEFDVMLSTCQTPFVFHDETLDRTTSAKGEVSSRSFHALSQLDAGSWFDPSFSKARIPALSEAMAWLVQTSMSANIEIKPLPGQDVLTAELTWQLVEPFVTKNHPTFLFSSFSIESLRALRAVAPDALMGLLLHDYQEDWRAICDELDCVSVHVFDQALTREWASEIKASSRALLCYTVNSPERAQALYSWGVDAVFSDFPDRILEAIR